jgi:TATA-box binding protein (TBP) (component of TFIID and TFIIIB)
MQVVNRVQTCSFALPLSLSECQERAQSFNLTTTMYKYRPTMLCIRYRGSAGACTLILFNSGKARYMGKDVEALEHLLQLEPLIIPSKRLTPLRQITRTVRVQLNIPSAYLPLSMDAYPRDCLWEPELFPAIQFQKWYPICVNVFHTGVAMVLGNTNDSQVFDICTELTATLQRCCKSR